VQYAIGGYYSSVKYRREQKIFENFKSSETQWQKMLGGSGCSWDSAKGVLDTITVTRRDDNSKSRGNSGEIFFEKLSLVDFSMKSFHPSIESDDDH
jgi:hypothetical protein